MLAYEANRSIVWGPHTLLKCLNFLGASCQCELSVTRDKLSAHTFAALRMYCVRILMSYLSMSRNSFRSSHIMTGDLDVRCVSTPMTD